MTALDQISSFQPTPSGTITDFKYSPSGQYLALADSQGFVHVYTKKDGKTYTKHSQFRADQGSIWSIAWADCRWGNLIGVGGFGSRVGVYQDMGGTWKEIAYHELHKGSVNWVQFAGCGLRLYAGSSDGNLSILQMYHKAWKTQMFSVGDSAIAAFALQQFPLGQSIAQQNQQKIYPRIATVTKDQKIKIWIHECEKLYSDNTQIFQQKQKSTNKCGYVLARQFPTPKQTIRNILWRPVWGTFSSSLASVPLLTCSQQGNLKSITLSISQSSSQKDKVKTILQGESQIIRISQSMTGNLLSVSLSNKNQQETIIYEEVDEDQWRVVKKGKL